MSALLDELKEYARKAIDGAMNELAQKGLERTIIATVQEVMKEVLNYGLRDAVSEVVMDYFETDGKQFIVDAIVKHLSKKEGE